MTTRILSFDTDQEKLRQEFIDFPYRHYRTLPDSRWIPPLRLSQEKLLNPDKNSFLKSAKIRLFLAKDGEKTVGRIAAIQNLASDQFSEDPATGFYGFFECVNSTETARALFDAATAWLKQQGYSRVLGPVSPSVHHECGLLVRGQSQHPTLGTPWNPKFYVELHESLGFTAAKDLVAYAIRVEQDEILSAHTQTQAHAESAQKNGRIRFRDFNPQQFEQDVRICFEIYLSAWEKNWGFYPPSWELFWELAQEMKPILDPRFAFIAEVENQPAGFMLAIPDYNHLFKRIRNGKLFPFGWLTLLAGKPFLKSVRIITLGVKPQFRRQGIFSAFTLESFRRARKHGVVAGEASWILEDNEAMTRPWEALGAPLYRRWRLYERAIPNDAL
jgi:GNAT superfamily N-acetyltransferase